MDRGVSAPDSSSRADNVGPARLELGGGRLVTVGAVLCGIMVAVRLALAAVAAGSGEPALIPWLVGGALAHALALAINRLRWPGLALVVGYLEVVVVSLAAAASTPVGATFALYVVAWAPVIYISPLWQHRLRHLWLLVAVLATVVIPGVVPDGEAKLVVASATSVGALCVVGAVIGLTVLALERSSAAVHQAQQLREQLEGRDALTGLLTRRRASERIAEEAARARRHGRPFSCVLADLDSFRAFGDRYGAACAEWVLVTVANLMKKAVRSTDAVARWDGQQFLMVLPETDAAGAAAAAERLRLAIEEGSFSFEGREVRFSVTFGVGVSGSLPEATGLAAAEAALAEGKQRGKNRVVIGPSEPDGVG
jgi:diguanylate cyclase (GGDEF)-like protein